MASFQAEWRNGLAVWDFSTASPAYETGSTMQPRKSVLHVPHQAAFDHLPKKKTFGERSEWTQIETRDDGSN